MQDPTRTRERMRAGWLALVAGAAIAAAKFVAFGLTGSSAVFSDAVESVVNVAAAGMLLYGLRIAVRPPDRDHPYGHGKVEFFSAGAEGTLIVLAAGLIVWQAAGELLRGPELAASGAGLWLLAGASAANAALGSWLVRTGRRIDSLAIEADGQHVLADVWTSVGVLVGLLAVRATGWLWLDPVIAIVVAGHVLWTGYGLVRRAVGGLMDEASEALLESIVAELSEGRPPAWIDVHSLRAWRSGDLVHVDLHMTVPRYLDIERAHEIDRRVGDIVRRAAAAPAEVIVHFDPCRAVMCTRCEMPSCEVREAAFLARPPWSLVAATAPSFQRGDDAGPVTAFIAFGSNLGDRRAHLREAVRALSATPGVEFVAGSRLYETDAVGPGEQGAYLNAVGQLRTSLSASALLARLLEIEREQGRERGDERNAPRTLDLDLLDYDGRILEGDAPPLELPHPRLHERAFVLEPLAELAGERLHPRLRERYESLAARVRDPRAVRRGPTPEGGEPWRSWP